MHCNHCGNSLPEKELAVCPFCGQKKAPARVKIFMKALAIVTVCALMSGMMALPFLQVSKLVVLFHFAAIIVVIVGIARESKKCFIAAGALVAGNIVACVGGYFGWLSFLDNISGNPFFWVWFVCVLVFLLLLLVFVYRYIDNASKVVLPFAAQKVYSDADLMLFRGLDDRERAGYYLLKAWLQRVVVVVGKESNSEGDTLLAINDALSEEDLNAYCRETPHVGRIVACLRTLQQKEIPATVAQVR